MSGMIFESYRVCPASSTGEVARITEKETAEILRPRDDPRFAKPEKRQPIKEDSGTYLIVHKRGR